MRRFLFVALALFTVLACSSSTKEKVPVDGTGGDASGDLATGEVQGDADPHLDQVSPDGSAEDVYVLPDSGDASQPEDIVADICLPDCSENNCGDDGCGGSCGACSETEVCGEDGQCGAPPCGSSKDCPGDLICHKARFICVECAVDADCLGEMLCDPDFHCFQPILCDSDKECKEADMVCDKEAGICVECLAHPDCPDDHFCQSKFCVADICPAGEVGCDGAAIATCNDVGDQWLAAVPCAPAQYCEAGECHDQLCAPGSAYCEETVRKLCDELGKAIIEEEDCAPLDLVCVNGECMDLICPPGAPFCVDDGTLGQCSEDGLEYTSDSCPATTWCDNAACIPWVCTPGESVCADATTVSICNDSGSGAGDETEDCAEGGLCCFNGACGAPAPEMCDEKDNNCNGQIDEGCDDDGDGFCDADFLVLGKPTVCPDGPGDCDDADESVFPGNKEVAGDGIDNDCDGSIDEVEACPGTCTGHTVEAYLCALEMCVAPAVISAEFSSPTGDTIDAAWEAVAHFGSLENDLAPWAGASYGLLATGPATGTVHSSDLPGGGGAPDPFSSDGFTTHDNVEFKVVMQAPQAALGFSIDYIFFSEEYEEYIGSSFNDKFYIILKAPQSGSGAMEVVNLTACSNPDSYHDVIDPVTGEKLCFLAINTAFSESCSDPKTDISGTGFECGPPDSAHGSSTGWLTTAWPVAPGETIDLIFHIHDTSDGIFDSEVILDNFQWLYVPFVPGTSEKLLD